MAEKKIKEKKAVILIDETARGEYTTSVVNGVLKCIILDTNSMINLKICLEEYPDIVLYEKQGYHGQKYLSLRNDVTFSNDEKAQGDGAEWYLNNKIRFIVEGTLGVEVAIIVRYT